MALRVQLVIFASAFVADSTRCSTCPAICKCRGTPPCRVVPDPLLGHGPSVMVWGQFI